MKFAYEKSLRELPKAAQSVKDAVKECKRVKTALENAVKEQL